MINNKEEFKEKYYNSIILLYVRYNEICLDKWKVFFIKT